MNREIFYFDDFTLCEYRELIQIAKKVYSFESYKSWIEKERFVLWRHDVDFSMHAALELAKIEKSENVKATYFLLPHSEFYNLLEKEISDLVKEIINLGHNIGLHFDSAFYGVNDINGLERYLVFEKQMLESLFGKEVSVFSFHNPFAFELSLQAVSYGGMLNTYATHFQNEIGYCSDSNGYWRHRRLKDVLQKAEDKSLQVLTHPEWWQKEVMSPAEKIRKCINGRADNNLKKYEKLLADNGRENIDW